MRRIVEGLGLSYRVNAKDLPGSPDVVLDRERLASFVHGCFWHVHGARCRRGLRIPMPACPAKRAYWHEKLLRNALRDRKVQADLEAAGWRVLEVWECERTPMTRLKLRRVLRG